LARLRVRTVSICLTRISFEMLSVAPDGEAPVANEMRFRRSEMDEQQGIAIMGA
jgi:hypothetical protein